MNRVDLHANSVVLNYHWECPNCYEDNEVTTEEFKIDLGNYPYGQEVTCKQCGKKYVIDDVNY